MRGSEGAGLGANDSPEADASFEKSVVGDE